MSKYWQMGALFFIVAIGVAAAVFAIVVRDGTKLLPLDSPEGALQRYLLALQKDNYDEAYQYLSASTKATCPFESFVRGDYYQRDEDSPITLERIEDLGNRAVIHVKIGSFDEGDLFGASDYSYDRMYTLELDGGQWRVTTEGSYAHCPPL